MLSRKEKRSRGAERMNRFDIKAKEIERRFFKKLKMGTKK